MEPTQTRTALCPHCRAVLEYVEDRDELGRLERKGFSCPGCGQRCGYYDPVPGELIRDRVPLPRLASFAFARLRLGRD